MGVSYLVFTLDEESAGWLRENGTNIESPRAPSRYPTLAELRDALSRLDGYTVEERRGGNSIDFDVVDARGYSEGWSTTIWAKSEDNDLTPPTDDEVVRITFHKGDPELAVKICEQLSRSCGPLVLILDIDGRPLLVQEHVNSEAVQKWLSD